MTFFFNQKRPKCKKRHPIQIEDVSINFKLIGNDKIDNFKEDFSKLNSELNEVNCQFPKTIIDKPTVNNKLEFSHSQNSYRKNYKKWCKASFSLTQELTDLLNDKRISVHNLFLKIYSDFEELKSDCFIAREIRAEGAALDTPVATVAKETRPTTARERNTVTALFVNNASEYKPNMPCIQFLLSSEKSSLYISDPNLETTFSTIEWAITKLNLSIKHKNITQEMEKKNSFNVKTKLIYYNETYKDSSTSNLYENAKDLNEILKCLSSSLISLNSSIDSSETQLFDCLSNDGTRSIMYPSGKLAILYFQKNDHHVLQVFNDNSNQILAQFSNSFGGMIFWVKNSNLRVVIEEIGCTMFDLNSDVVKDMKWPSNIKNKLPHSINIRLNDHIHFHCSGKDCIFIKFETKEEKKRVIEIKLHNWLFKEYNVEEEKKYLIANICYTSQSATEMLKQSTSKQAKKENIPPTPEQQNFFEIKLSALKSDIRSHFNDWLTFIKDRIQFDGKLTQRKVVKSAVISRGRTLNFSIGNSALVSHTGQRNISAPFRHINTENSITDNAYSQKKLFPGRLQSAIDRKETTISFTTCPLKIRSGLLKKLNHGSQIDLLGSECCLCSKTTVTEITDLELNNFLRVVNSNQLVIIGVISTQNENSSEERSKEKFIEESLASLISDLYIEDLKKTTQKPCLAYHHKYYRLYFYNISCSGRFLNSIQSLLLRKHNILPGMCLMFKESKLLFADYIFNGYKTTKGDLFKQINLCQKLFKEGFYLPNDYQLNFNNQSKQWIEETAYSKIMEYNYISKKRAQEQLSCN